jgi:hypothetical protein
MSRRFTVFLLVSVPVTVLLAVLIYNIPPVHERLAWRVDDLRTRIQYAIKPPEKVVFIPEEQIKPIVEATLRALTPMVTSTASVIYRLQQGPRKRRSSATPTATATPLPEVLRLEGVNMRPAQPLELLRSANMSWRLRSGVGRRPGCRRNYVKTNDDDKNVMPYELADLWRLR